MKKLLSILAMSSMLAACTATTNKDGTVIKIGFIGPLTGDAAGIGKDLLNGAMLAVEEINAKGGVQIELIAEDGRCNGADATSAAQKLINVDHVAAILGGACSGETLAVAPLAESSKTVLLSGGSSSPDVTSAGTFVFRNYPSDALKTKAMAKYFAEEGITKVALISENTDFSQGFRASLKKDLPEGTLIFDEVSEAGVKDFRTLLTRLKGQDFDIFFPNANSDAVMGPMLQQFRDAGFTESAIAHDVADTPNLAKEIPEASEGFFVLNVSSVTNDPSFESDFRQKFGDPQYGFAYAGYAYDNMYIFANAIEAGAGAGEAMRDWLLAMPPYAGVVGTFSFDENGDVTGIPYQLKQFKGGVITKVKDIAVN